MESDGGASIAERLRRDIGRLTPNERRAAHRLLAEYPMAGLDTAARFGEAAGVSAPTVLRMIAKLGFASYGAFQDGLKAELAAQRETPLTKGGTRRDGDPLDTFARAAIANLRATAENVPREEFDAAVRLIADPRRPLHLLGGRFTDAIAAYMAAHLRVLRPQVQHIEGQPAAWFDRLLDIGKQDVIVLFDIRRYSDDLIGFAERAAGRGARIILITDQWLSPISKVARHVLPAHVPAPSVWDSSAGLLLLAEALT
ncbi:MAG: MurR/RpiR family transcriptional regulator, partial [Rhizobiales bacterium]|nr:MurR/RpiR family transcriptional regulator [Hyphomicrobiales bacterium]